MLFRDSSLPAHTPPGVTVHRLVHDEERLLLPPGSEESLADDVSALLRPGSFDCVVSNLSLVAHYARPTPL